MFRGVANSLLAGRVGGGTDSSSDSHPVLWRLFACAAGVGGNGVVELACQASFHALAEGNPRPAIETKKRQLLLC